MVEAKPVDFDDNAWFDGNLKLTEEISSIATSFTSTNPGSPPHCQENLLHRRHNLEEEFLQLSTESLSLVSSDSDTSCSVDDLCNSDEDNCLSNEELSNGMVDDHPKEFSHDRYRERRHGVVHVKCRESEHGQQVFTAEKLGQDGDKLVFGFLDRQGKRVDALLSATKRMEAEGNIMCALCFLHVTNPDLQHALQLHGMSEYSSANSLQELTYIRQEIKNPLNGIMFTRSLMGASELSKEHKQVMKSSTLCQEQLGMILSDANLESVEECYLEMNILEFSLGEALETVMIQGKPLCQERQV